MMTPTLQRVRALASASFLLVFLASASGAQGTGLVASSDLVYADIERLSELGVLDSTVIGQRPYSRREIARIAGVARARLDGRNPGLEPVSAFAEGLVRRLERFNGGAGDESSNGDIALIDGLTLSFVSTDADRRGFPAANSKPVEATIDPLARRRLGMPSVRGETGSLEISHRIEPTSWLALQARERVEYRRPNDTTLKKDAGELLLASLRARIGNLAVTVGRQQLTWSQSEGDGLFLASD
ncbi:MAG: hypothetical protein ABI625_28235, partial [bacterium]